MIIQAGSDRTMAAVAVPPRLRMTQVADRARSLICVLTLGIVAALLPSQAAWSAPGDCTSPAGGGPVWITADCVDPLYDKPVIDSEKDVTSPSPHHQVSGHFAGTDKRFNFYFPPKQDWEGRFYDKLYPLDSEEANSDTIAFGAEGGAYTVQTNAGGAGYRVDAAAAKFSRTVAADYYDWTGRIYGYVWGGSGGSFMAIGAIENSTGVWDGAVPFINGAPTSLPNNYSARALAQLVLQGKASGIADAVRVGSRRSPYRGLNRREQQVLREVTRMGIPLRAWDDYHYLLGLSDDPTGPAGGVSNLYFFLGTVKAIDPTYADDFWSKPGYLGTEKSDLGSFVRRARIDHSAIISEVHRNAAGEATSVVLDSVPAQESAVPLDYTVTSADGVAVGSVTGELDRGTKVFRLAAGGSAEVLDALKVGASVRIDNRWAIAFTTYHRHQVPARSGFYPWDQFRKSDGSAKYPQRSLEIGPLVTAQIGGGGTFTGKITGKVIVVDNLIDADAFPWQGDWYAREVEKALGASFDDTFRIWYNDHADHVDPHTPRLVNYGGMYEQALADLAAWVERGVKPPRSTRYSVDGSQIVVPVRAAARRGIQPVVNLSVKGQQGSRVDIRAGQSVTFHGMIEVPPRAGTIVSTAWDPEGTGTFTDEKVRHPQTQLQVRIRHTYSKPGTYFASLRATSQRDGKQDTRFTLVRNLDTIRVVVR